MLYSKWDVTGGNRVKTVVETLPCVTRLGSVTAGSSSEGGGRSERQRRGVGDVTAEAVIGVTSFEDGEKGPRLRAESAGNHLKLERQGDRFSRRASRGNQPAGTC